MVLITLREFLESKRKKYYGSSKKVYRNSHIERVLAMQRDLAYLGELYTRTRLVPCNDDFLVMKAIPHYNDCLKKMQKKYPNIKEFQGYKVAVIPPDIPIELKRKSKAYNKFIKSIN